MPEIDERAFRKHLEWLVDLVPQESAPYIENRPRFVHAVLVLADNSLPGEMIKASCIKQLDPEIVERRTKLTQMTETDVPYTTNEQYSIKSSALIDSGIHENQVSSEEETDKLETTNVPTEHICPTQQITYVPLSKYVHQQEHPFTSNEKSSQKLSDQNGNAQYYSQGFVVDNKLSQQREGALFVGKDGGHEVPINVKQETSATRSENANYHNANDTQRIKTENYSYKIPQLQGTVYERPEIISRTYRSHVEETTFPSIDRYRTVRSETVRIEPRSPRTLLNSTPLDGKTTRTTTETYTVTSVPQPPANDDVIAQAVQILQSSCDMLDETVDRIQRRKLLSGQNSAFNFPSENRNKPKTTA